MANDTITQADDILVKITRNEKIDPTKLSIKVLKKCIKETMNTKIHGGHKSLIIAYDIFVAERNRRIKKIFLLVTIVGVLVTILTIVL